jgi:hypothetical protein
LGDELIDGDASSCICFSDPMTAITCFGSEWHRRPTDPRFRSALRRALSHTPKYVALQLSQMRLALFFYRPADYHFSKSSSSPNCAQTKASWALQRAHRLLDPFSNSNSPRHLSRPLLMPSSDYKTLFSLCWPACDTRTLATRTF